MILKYYHQLFYQYPNHHRYYKEQLELYLPLLIFIYIWIITSSIICDCSCSYSIYLFHGPLLTIWVSGIRFLQLSPGIQDLITMSVAVPAVLIMAYLIQRAESIIKMMVTGAQTLQPGYIEKVRMNWLSYNRGK